MKDAAATRTLLPVHRRVVFSKRKGEGERSLVAGGNPPLYTLNSSQPWVKRKILLASPACKATRDYT